MTEKPQKEAEILPALDNKQFNDSFTPIDYDANNKQTTIADLEHLNTLLACCHQALPCLRTVSGLIGLTAATCKLIEVRRNVKQLPYGALKTVQRQGRTIEVLD